MKLFKKPFCAAQFSRNCEIIQVFWQKSYLKRSFLNDRWAIQIGMFGTYKNRSVVRSIEFDNDSSSYFDNFLRNPMFKSLFIPYSFHVIPYKSLQKAWLRCAISGKLRNYPSNLTKIIAETETFIFWILCVCSIASGMFKKSLNVFPLLNIF